MVKEIMYKAAISVQHDKIRGSVIWLILWHIFQKHFFYSIQIGNIFTRTKRSRPFFYL